MILDEHLKEEAQAFDRRITERVAAGFIPDIRRAVKCEYFHKSFWRDPRFVRIFLGGKLQTILRLFRDHAGENLRVLDVGCGPGYFSLEFARVGYHVKGIDISSRVITAAEEAARGNPITENFGSLQYQVMPLHEEEGTYDIVFFRGTLHHFEDVEAAILKSRELLAPGGIIVCNEPCHEQWRHTEAAQVAFLRQLLSLTGFWFESLEETLANRDSFERHVEEVYTEYVEDRDRFDERQSPHDHACSGDEILSLLSQHFVELEYIQDLSFIYRMLGGLRGPDETIYKIADLMVLYDRYCVDMGFLRPKAFFFAGRRV